jgi:hypothetical protein
LGTGRVGSGCGFRAGRGAEAKKDAMRLLLSLIVRAQLFFASPIGKPLYK